MKPVSEYTDKPISEETLRKSIEREKRERKNDINNLILSKHKNKCLCGSKNVEVYCISKLLCGYKK